MKTWRVTDKVAIYRTVDVQAETAEEAIAIAESSDPTTENDLEWSYSTDYDESLGIEAEPLPDRHPCRTAAQEDES